MSLIALYIDSNRRTYSNVRKENRDFCALSQGQHGEGIKNEQIYNNPNKNKAGRIRTNRQETSAAGINLEVSSFEKPSTPTVSKIFNAIDLFAGIGGIRLGFKQAFGNRIKFVWGNDIDRYCAKTYQSNFGDDLDTRDINQIIEMKNISEIPEHDILLGGFPCQPFSIAGAKEGFQDKTRGTLFFAIARILDERKPLAFLLENVKYFKNHDQGRTWKTIKEVLENDLNYRVFAETLNASNFGLPQNRERFYIVGFKDKTLEFTFPKGKCERPLLASFLEKNVDSKYYLSQEYLNGLKRHRERHESMGHGFGYVVLDPQKDIANTLVVGGMGKERNLIKDVLLLDAWKPGDKDIRKRNSEGIRKLTPREFANLQGFPQDYVIPISNVQAYKQFANSVPVPVVKAIAEQMLKTLDGQISYEKLTAYFSLENPSNKMHSKNRFC
jgi:DNA (cytosine-5)-methyltransferase 1